jgi:hypothetical protein
MCRNVSGVAVLLLFVTSVCAAGSYVKPTTTLAAQTANNTSAASSFVTQTNGNAGAANVSKVDVHSLLYSGATTKVYAHLMVWFGGSNHMNVGYSSTDASQVHNQVMDMISRGIDGVIIDWYGPNNNEDAATKLVMAEAESHPGFTFAIAIDQGAIEWDSCSGCTPQQALVSDLQYIEQTYFPSKAYLTLQGSPVVTNFDIDLHYTVDWNAAKAALSTAPVFLFQNYSGFTHVLSDGSYSWVMPTTTDYGMSYLKGFYNTGIPFTSEQTVGAGYKGFNDSLASWGLGRVMGQQCGQTWLQTFSEINSLYHSGKQLSALQLVTWNDYEEGTEIESGIKNCFTISAKQSGNSLQWTITGAESTIDHYVAYISTDGQNLMSLGNVNTGLTSVNLCSYSVPNGSYTFYVQAVGKPSVSNQMSGAVKFTSSCTTGTTSNPTVSLGTSPSSVTIQSGGSGNLTVTATPESGAFNDAIALTCSGLPKGLTCSFSPASITPGAIAVGSVLTVSAATRSAAENRRERSNVMFATWMFSFGLVGLTLIGKVQCKRIFAVLGACILAAMIVGASSCGGGTGVASSASSPTSPSGPSSPTGPSGSAASYTVTINGSAGSVQLATAVTVTVQ